MATCRGHTLRIRTWEVFRIPDQLNDMTTNLGRLERVSDLCLSTCSSLRQLGNLVMNLHSGLFVPLNCLLESLVINARKLGALDCAGASFCSCLLYTSPSPRD